MKRFLTTPLIVLAAICAAGVALGHTVLHRASAHHVQHHYRGPQLVIPALGVHATIVGIGADGTVGNADLRIPSNVHRVGWWNGKVFNGTRRTRVPAPRPVSPVWRCSPAMWIRLSTARGRCTTCATSSAAT